MKKLLLIFVGMILCGNAFSQGCPNAQNSAMNMQLFQYNLATATPNATPTWVSTPIAAIAPPQALAAITVLPTPVGQGTPVPGLASGSGQLFIWPNGPRDNVSPFSASASLTTPVTIATAGTSMFLDIGPSVVHNTSSTSVAFTIKKGTTVLWSDISDAGTYTFIPSLYCGGTAAQSYIFTLGAAVTQVFWNGSYISNGR